MAPLRSCPGVRKGQQGKLRAAVTPAAVYNRLTLTGKGKGECPGELSQAPLAVMARDSCRAGDSEEEEEEEADRLIWDSSCVVCCHLGSTQLSLSVSSPLFNRRLMS
ncbi:unnamed protein product [Pleuronectes platessa]|uniref:Uncharacterized protein n=1 Tax=Pleuronectes platessa TaxID=8262 RepID=A0A9N7YPX6_PLEPL|nr:unnamed protein product [Pleuronectes platessa]